MAIRDDINNIEKVQIVCTSTFIDFLPFRGLLSIHIYRHYRVSRVAIDLLSDLLGKFYSSLSDNKDFLSN